MSQRLHTPQPWASLAAALLMVTASCGQPPECPAGLQQACSCEDEQSYRLCGVDSRWGPCLCERAIPADTAGDLDATVDAGADAGADVGIDTQASPDSATGEPDTTAGGDVQAPADATATSPEVCNGEDDDGDGAVDEWTAATNPSCRITVAAGTFLMGCQGGDLSCDADESPAHEVSLAGFQLDRTEATQAAWSACVIAGACPTPPDFYTPEAAPDYPVVMVTRAEAADFCAWRGGRLPTEAEWERASGGGKGRRWPWGGAEPSCKRANIKGCGGDPWRVGRAGALGASLEKAYGMAGNVAEWVSDDYNSEVYAKHADGVSAPKVVVQGSATGVARGGSMYWGAAVARASNRMPMASEARHPDLGVRCAYGP